MSNSIRLLKAASVAGASGAFLAKTIRTVAKGGAAVVKGGAAAGGGAAKVLGAPPVVGKVVGGGAVVGSGALGVKELDKRRRIWLYQHNFGGY